MTNPKMRDLSLWSFLRGVLSQGGDIWLDHREKSYEEYSIRLDAAARERAAELEKALSNAHEPAGDPPSLGRPPRHEHPCNGVFLISPLENHCLNCGWMVRDHQNAPQPVNRS